MANYRAKFFEILFGPTPPRTPPAPGKATDAPAASPPPSAQVPPARPRRWPGKQRNLGLTPGLHSDLRKFG